ncbi:helicase sen1 [Vanessa cardui]|uniref:helicase sen1 n=1 Tax=Vanessa cardui TaxID=171605 RepID=UPI001F13A3B2|nr:helicase sen1 [Vanessa cardui]
MAKWKLCRQTFGNEEFEFTEGDEVRIGRGLDNTITLSSIVISRNHCLINVKRHEVTITDLKSSNGIYVGLKRIPPNIPYTLSEDDLIGFGWTIGAPLVKIMDSEKFVFKLIKTVVASIVSRIHFQSNSEEDIEVDSYVSNTKEHKPVIKNEESPNSKTMLQLKRKLNVESKISDLKKEPDDKFDDDIINIISDSDNEPKAQECFSKKIKLDPIIEDLTKDNIKTENEDLQYEAFNVKQEYLGYDDDEPIQIDSDSDSESEQWFLRLSQSSPGKPFTKIEQNRTDKLDTSIEDSSYSQLDDIVFNNIDKDNDEEDFIDDIITIPPELPEIQPIPETKELESASTSSKVEEILERDQVDGVSVEDNTNELEEALVPVQQGPHTSIKMAQMIEPLVKPSRRKSHYQSTESKSKSKSNNKKKTNKHTSSSSSSKKSISNSQKEERKKKLKEIADKEKETDDTNKKITNNTNKVVSNVKVTTSNRGAFLTDVIKATVKPMKRRNSQEKEKIKSPTLESKIINEPLQKLAESNDGCEKSDANVSIISTKTKEKPIENRKSKSQSSNKTSPKSCESEYRIPARSLKPLNDSKESQSGKPVSKVEPLPPKKPAKRVRFSNAEPVVHLFQIEPGNKMNKTKLVKTRLLDVRQKPIFSLEKITLMKILRWNPQWLNEQMNTADPPPILGHNNPPMAIYHSFDSHRQYIGLVGDLLLMEIWECITQAYMRIRNQNNGLPLRIESLPPVPPQERYFDLFNLSVNISLPNSEMKHLPRVGEIMMVEFGPENAKICRFFFVHNVRCLPSPKNSKTFSLSLYATFTDKMMYLKSGELVIGRNLAYINNELTLFEAMEYLAGSPLSQAILRPQTCHYPTHDTTINMNTQWTKTLNPSQKLAVSRSVSAALGDEPSLQMVQGPPGTGKSSVICAMVMTYFYNAMNKRYQDRGKILICATSNAAVDELVIRLLNIRQSLPKEERFRMVRVGRLEAMHARARDVSSQQLAQRDHARARADAAPPARHEEISHLEAKINMWKTQARDAKDPVRVAYCQGKVANLAERINLLRGGGAEGEALRPERLLHAERRIIDCAHIIVTTLASAHNYKMRGLKGRIALCIVDEAGQAIEPETLIPLTLDVTRLTLIGDPQQLPGFICSQRAKQHGLAESLFSRLSSGGADPRDGPVVLLDQQYRMHPAIADYPNRAFYGGRVRSVAPPPASLDLPPYTMLAISSGDKGQGQSGANEMEAWGVARVAAALAGGVRARRLSLAVITPYSAHRDLLRSCLRALQDPSESPVEVNTVDSFQGQERDVVVVSLARSHGVGFLTDTGRMNVMLTRARHALLVCLNPLALVRNNQWQTLVDDARNRRVYKTLPNKICQHASVRSISNAEVLNYVTSS